MDNSIKLKKALEMYQEVWLQTYADEHTLSRYSFSRDFEKKMANLIKRQKKPYYSLVDTIGKRVAVIVLAIFLALAGTVFSVEALREPVIDFVTEIYEMFTNIIFEDPEGGDFYKTETYYAPRYIPQGFILEDTQTTRIYSRYVYTNSRGDFITYNQLILDHYTIMVDTEATYSEPINIGGLDGLFYENKNNNNLVWNDDIYVYQLTAPLTINLDELISMALSLDE
ncbi:MAG TPA: DUF4367 domain-containing protein [Bacillota bacterium]|nr:DUF4367 domain-containing protein [Bacillota bacterium]